VATLVTTPGASPESSVLNFVIRMVVPMRREFGRSLDVQLFLRDPEYARVVLEQALASRDQRLRDYADYVSRHLSGARVANPPPVPSTPAAKAAPATVAESTVPGAFAVAPDSADADPTEEELKARMLRKYTTGLR
jgi:hypothetical protein